MCRVISLGVASCLALLGCASESTSKPATTSPMASSTDDAVVAVTSGVSESTNPAETTTTVGQLGLIIDPRVSPNRDLAPVETCKISDVTTESIDASSGFPRPESAAPLSGFRLLVVPVSTSDLDFDDDDRQFVVKSLEEADAFYSYMSSSLVDLDWKIFDEVDRLKFSESAERLGLFGGPQMTRKPVVERVVDLIESEISSETFDALVVYFPADDSILFGEAMQVEFGKETETINAVIIGGGYTRFWEVLAHELGHSWLGLEDLYLFETSGMPLGAWDLMQLALLVKGKTLTAWNRWLASWIPDSSVRCVSAGSTMHYLAPLSEGVDKPQLVAIPTGEGSVMVIESRRASIYDEVEPTVIVYSVNTNNRSGFGPFELKAELTSVGQVETVGNIEIELIEQSDEGDLVAVTIG